jgi:glutamine amidotransferase
MIAIIKYNAGNIKSVQNALNRLGYDNIITDDPEDLLRADKVIVPGVGEAGTAMRYLKERGLDKTILSLNKPVLGICLGLQLMCRYSEEGNTRCLGIFDSDVRLFPPLDKIPHMGWDPEDDVYYVHSYFADISTCTTAICDYIHPFSAAMNSGNFYATQFHPEKSAGTGEKILRNFLSL